MASENRSEQATPRRRQKAREQGRVPRSRELATSLAMCLMIFVMAWQMGKGIGQWRFLFRNLLVQSSGEKLSPALGFLVLHQTAVYWLYPALAGCLVVAVVGCAAQGGLVFAPALLKPQWSRLSPASRAQQLFSPTTLIHLAKTLIPAAVITYLLAAAITRDWNALCGSLLLHTRSLTAMTGGRVFEAAWKCALVLTCWSVTEFFLERLRHERDLRMTRQEVREEAKESEGNPQIKARIRKLQRQTRRKRMLEDVAKAAVVITNPTQYAIALEYSDRLLAPMVVAKGRNLLAQQIKETARWHGVPAIENVPLAHALYRATEVGQVIPSKLYAAVAEVLAYLMRAQARATKEAR